jgi:hypothetical protein
VKYKSIVTAVAIFQEGDHPIFGETLTTLRMNDEGDGDGIFIDISQDSEREAGGVIRINDMEELNIICESAREMFRSIREQEREQMILNEAAHT